MRKLNEIGEVYIVTNGTAWIQDSRFARSNLLQYAKQAFISERVGYDKPDKRYTDYVIKHIPNFSIEKAVWIGDSLSADIRAANEVGITSIWYNRHKKVLNGDIIPVFNAENFHSILAFLQTLN